MKAAFRLLPKSDKREQAEKQLMVAEEALKRSDVALAQKLGYRLCQCTFPPQIMLFKQDEGVKVCPLCGDTYPPPEPRVERGEGSWAKAGRR